MIEELEFIILDNSLNLKLNIFDIILVFIIYEKKTHKYEVKIIVIDIISSVIIVNKEYAKMQRGA